MANPLTDLQHLELAEEFYQAFRDLPSNGPSGIPINWPRYFALCHATELALNAFLLAHGLSERQLKRMGHNISDLMAEAITRGLNIGSLARSELDCLSQAHEEYWARYPKKNANPVFIIDDFEKYFVELLTAVRLAIRGGTPLWVNY